MLLQVLQCASIMPVVSGLTLNSTRRRHTLHLIEINSGEAFNDALQRQSDLPTPAVMPFNFAYIRQNALEGGCPGKRLSPRPATTQGDYARSSISRGGRAM